MSKKCNQIAEGVSQEEGNEATTSQPTLDSGGEEYSAEAALIVENKSKRDAVARNKAVALGIFSFVTMRTGRGLSSWMRKSIASRAGRTTYQFDKVPGLSVKRIKPELSSKRNTMNSSAELKQPTKVRTFLRLVFDATISTSITLLSGAFLFRPRPSAYIEDMSKLPLVEGKSIYAEMVCPPLLKEYQRVLEKYGGRWPVRKASSSDDNNVTQEDVSLNTIRSFVENCSKRSKYERALMEERNALNFDNESNSTVSSIMRKLTMTKPGNISENRGDNTLSGNSTKKLGTVSIPSPGVPEDISVNLDKDLLSLAADNDVQKGQKSKNNKCEA